MSKPTDSKRRWSDLSPAQQGAVIAVGALQFGLQAFALRDLKRRPARQVRGPKPAWAAASFINFLGPLAYLRWGRR
ncbi:PLD nuclease N-terminal domain-containing protein [Svornostia abyssi]|uniref:PLD nuclease N-terminal domain-containing protein n=1 Tax=Svornostia abyssi TaxID=2898438 RepID=A0ABY5PCI3_9ACTN|nr:PLD nuclease N-terminal domain-containing protein [Parviterribacteraceae bacterium J379]